MKPDASVAHQTLVPDPVMIRIEDLHRSFGDLCVLDGVSLDIRQGKTTTLLGPSGCGKSVLLKHIVGLLTPDAGHVWIDGIDMARASEREKRKIRTTLGMLFQGGALFEDRCAGDNIAFPLEHHTTLDGPQRRARVEELLELVELPGLYDRSTAALSGGQRKRVALARAIVLEPRIVLFDEPSSGLDPMTASTIDDLIVRMQAHLGVTFVIITHDIAQAQRVSDWAGMLWQGKLVAYAPIDTFLRSPHPVVRRFLERHR